MREPGATEACAAPWWWPPLVRICPAAIHPSIDRSEIIQKGYPVKASGAAKRRPTCPFFVSGVSDPAPGMCLTILISSH
jgi:hypothetical protein